MKEDAKKLTEALPRHIVRAGAKDQAYTLMGVKESLSTKPLRQKTASLTSAHLKQQIQANANTASAVTPSATPSSYVIHPKKSEK